MFNKMVIPTNGNGGEEVSPSFSIDEYNLNGASGTPFEAMCTNALFCVTTAQGLSSSTTYTIGYLQDGVLTFIYDYGNWVSGGSSYTDGKLRLFSVANAALWLKIMYI